MSTLNLDALGLQPDPGDPQPGQPAAPAPVAAPAAPAAPQSVTGLLAPAVTAPAPVAAPAAPQTAQADPVPPDDEIVVPEGAENPDAVKRLIQEERAAARSAYKRARDAEAQLAAITEANMPIEQRLTAVEQRASAAELRATKLAVGMRHGLSLTFSELLQGSNETELDTHAQAVIAELGQRRAPAAVPGVTLGGGTQPPPVAAPADPAKAHDNWLLARISGQRPGA